MARYTIKDIARELGLSPSTVSRALRGHPDISEATRERVAKLAEKYNYRPNQIAKSLQTRKSKTIGVIVPEIQHYFFSAVVSGIEEVAYKAGYTIMVCQSNDTFEREVINTQALASHQVDGLLVSVSQETTSHDHLEAVLRQGTPLVFFDRVVEGLKASTVVVDDFDGAYTAVEHLISRGYRRIAHLAGVQHISISRQRLFGYRQALADHVLPVEERYIVYGGFHEPDGQKGAAELMGQENPPDAIFSVNDPVAVGAFLHCRDKGLRIPEDVALVGFSNNPVTMMVTPTLTTVEQPAFAIGRSAATILLAQIRGENKVGSPLTRTLKTSLVVRGST